MPHGAYLPQRGIAALGAGRPTSLRPAAVRHRIHPFHSMTSSGEHRERDGHAIFGPRDEPCHISWVVAGDEMSDTPQDRAQRSR